MRGLAARVRFFERGEPIRVRHFGVKQEPVFASFDERFAFDQLFKNSMQVAIRHVHLVFLNLGE